MRRSLHESKTTQTEINCSQKLQFQTLFRSFVGSLVCARYQKNNNLTSHHLLGGSIAHSRLSGHRPSANDVTGGGGSDNKLCVCNSSEQFSRILCREYLTSQIPNQCDQIWQFIELWATFQSLWKQLFCPNRPHFQYFLIVKYIFGQLFY